MNLRLWHVVFFVAALLAFAIMRAPAALVARRDGLTYARAEGTIWKARFEDVRLASLDAGDLEWRLSFSDLIQGKMNAHARLSGRDMTGEISLLADWRGNRRLIAPELRVERAPLGRMMLEAPTTIRNLDIHYSKGRCVAAQGALKSEISSSNAALSRWRGADLSGTASCAGEIALLTLDGGGEGRELHSAFELHADGAGIWRAELSSNTLGSAQALGAAGFSLGPEGKSASIRRDFRWFPF